MHPTALCTHYRHYKKQYRHKPYCCVDRSTHVLSPDIMHVYIANTKDDYDFLALLSSDDCSTSVSHCLNHYLLNHAMKFESWWLTIIRLVKCTCFQAHSMHFLVRAHAGHLLVASILFQFLPLILQPWPGDDTADNVDKMVGFSFWHCSGDSEGSSSKLVARCLLFTGYNIDLTAQL